MTRHSQRTSHIISQVIANAEAEETITIGRFIEALGDRAFGIAMLIFALPNAIPAPGIPGVSTITSIPIILCSLQMVLGYKKLWLPKRVKSYQFSQAKLAGVLKKGLPYLGKVERFLRPRAEFMSTLLAERLLGVLIIVLAIILSLPILFGNFLPAFSICVLALGLIERDGVVIGVGILSGIISCFIISTALFVVVKGIIAAVKAYSIFHLQ